MNEWTRPEDLRTRLQKQWDKGRFLSAQVMAAPLFPLRLPLKHPGPRELGDRYGLEKSMVVFGLGYGLERLAKSAWLAGKTIYYWGDIDTHGFAMLDRIRRYFPQTLSLLMDLGTLMDHRALWGTEQSPLTRDLTHLNPAETALYAGLRQNLWAPALRQEQERISYTCLKAAL